MNRVTASIVGIMIEGQLQGNWLPKSSAAGHEWKDKLKKLKSENYCVETFATPTVALKKP
jgi:hypothetical protein